jgi:hypothetical protein
MSTRFKTGLGTTKNNGTTPDDTICAMRLLGIDPILQDKFKDEFLYMPMESYLMRYADEVQASYKEAYEPSFKALFG